MEVDINFITRAYNTFEINKFGIITKISKDSKLIDEINYYKQIEKIPLVSSFFVRHYDTSIGNENKIQLEYINYNNLYEQIIDDNTEYTTLKGISTALCEILSTFHKNTPDNIHLYHDSCEKMYKDKTLNEYKKLIDSNTYFFKLSLHKKLNINGIKYNNFESIKFEILNYITKLLCNNFDITIVHGDFCFGNILASHNENKKITSVKLIDPRGSWGVNGIYGDPRYDVAKLYHSFDGKYEYLTNKKYKLIELNKNSFEYQYEQNKNIDIIKDYMIEDIQRLLKYDIREYKLIEGLIYIGMCARHYDSIDRQKMMYLTGIKLLNEFLESI